MTREQADRRPEKIQLGLTQERNNYSDEALHFFASNLINLVSSKTAEFLRVPIGNEFRRMQSEQFGAGPPHAGVELPA
jgi:hypothetical protein